MKTKPKDTTQRPLARREGYPDFMSGFVTTLASVVGATPAELERRLGYAPGRLAQGFTLYFLAQGVGPWEFHWAGRTRHSAGWVDDADAYAAAGSMIQWADRVRYSMAVAYGGDTEKADRHFDKLLADQYVQLNVRDGPKRIVKVVPAVPSTKDDVFPDALGRGVPQWVLLVKKKFYCAAVVSPGATYLGGAAGQALVRSD